MSWTELIGHKGAILWWEMSIRAVLVFIFGLVLIRLFGRRAFGKQNPLDIVVAIIVGSSLSRALTGNAPFISTIIAMAVLVSLFWVLEHAAARWHWLGRLAKGDPVWLAGDHHLDRSVMKWWGVTEGDICEAARNAGVAELDAIREAVLERSGKISTVSRK
jgi:uncharacterized membrane protein YcaP (DUF421 family)